MCTQSHSFLCRCHLERSVNAIAMLIKRGGSERESERKQTERRLPLCKICRSFGIVNVSRSASCCQIFKSHTNCPATMHEHNKINESHSGVECRSRHEILMWLHTQIAPRKKNSKVFFTLLRFSILKSTCSKLSCLPLLFSAFSRHEVWESGPETPLGQQRTPAHGKYISRWWSMFDCESSTRGECFSRFMSWCFVVGRRFRIHFYPSPSRRSPTALDMQIRLRHE